jgi:hypothetical protein
MQQHWLLDLCSASGLGPRLGCLIQRLFEILSSLENCCYLKFIYFRWALLKLSISSLHIPLHSWHVLVAHLSLNGLIHVFLRNLLMDLYTKSTLTYAFYLTKFDFLPLSHKECTSSFLGKSNYLKVWPSLHRSIKIFIKPDRYCENIFHPESNDTNLVA